MDMIEMRVEGIGIDQGNRTLVLLRDTERRRFLPIWIGPSEAVAIAMELENKHAPRPMTHDLMTSILSELGVRVSRIVVSDFRDSTFYATVTLLDETGVREVDARPSDAIALALRAKAKIFVNEEVADQTAILLQEGQELPLGMQTDEDSTAEPEEIDRFMKLLQGVNLDQKPS
ncbi:MAG: hypothetical protein COZ06_28195 [Armatimonadetes bacterium CG_4_10_14_3_um_filter_66_18]|nr:MAG: hypothetical protein COS65_18035 [Armatimonadetes bacterium CG06_land_8_20_14_3_00_66_21]PIX44490.1 MAG: hypothetical protein COZ57_17460 [Armatimonadetes bacterium CG_4_8_14_3_um_filter_66_20]PIY40425.1 MAG: hypothetical protein COZ06_28195 [Armatimonadetes bacterium CG_4_10_14_3_um_filter_66_18]PIZ32268.1 MAG: hypothetical protein COY42_31435 [Armatimonadetes bacterium CG_4_10_14_0_8_um_filter_66_14]PJB69449.1 MAG: hypothetical protein CO096_13080 [Armatimonadetes bacterium CG_4_9_14_